MQQIVLKKIEKPLEKDIVKDINWVCDSFALSSGRDTSSIANKIVAGVIEKLSRNIRISSDMLANDLKITKATVNHHLRNLISSGLIYREKRLIYIRGGSLKAAVEEIRKDANRILDEIESIAEEIDNRFGLRHRD